jgi:hypothetical protein
MNLRNSIVFATVFGLWVLIPFVAMAASNKLIVKDSLSNNGFVVTDQTFVGIGKNPVPLAAIHVDGTTIPDPGSGAYDPTSQIRVHSVGNNGPYTGGGFLGLQNNPDSPSSYPKNGDRLGYFLFGTQRANGLDYPGAGLAAFAAGDWTESSTPSFFTLETAGTAPGRRTRVVISPEGNVGIGLDKVFASQQLEVIGGIKINNLTPQADKVTFPNPVKPNCNSTDGPTTRGTLWFTYGGSAADILQICTYDGSTYSWKTVNLSP